MAVICKLPHKNNQAGGIQCRDTYSLGSGNLQGLIDIIADQVANRLLARQDVVDHLLSETKELPLSARQGNILDNRLVDVERNFLDENKNVYVDAANGNDTTGDGTQAKPWATIQKAVDECPAEIINYVYYYVYIADGEYNESEIFVRDKKRIVFRSVSSNPNITINTKWIMINYADLYIEPKITINATEAAITVNNASIVSISSNSMVINSDKNALITSGSGILIIRWNANVIINKAKKGLVCEGGQIYQYNKNVLSFGNDVVTKYDVHGGGALQFDSQGWQLIGSVTGRHGVNIDFDLYTEFLTVQNFTNGSEKLNVTNYITSTEIKSQDFYDKFDGWYSTDTHKACGQIRSYKTSKSIENRSFRFNGTEIIDQVTMTVYGKR